jgi:hypothetical protein
MDSPARFTRPFVAFAIGMPLAWAVLLWFHPNVDADDVLGTLRDDVVTYQVVHVGTLVGIGLIGLALYMLVRDMPGTAAKVSRMAIGPFVVLYGAWETVVGLGVGALVQHANDAPAAQQAAIAETIQSIGQNSLVGDAGIVGLLGFLAWVVATVAAAVAYKNAGAPVAAWMLLGLSLLIGSHPPPIGPIGLVCFAGAVALLARHERAPAVVSARPPVPTPAA